MFKLAAEKNVRTVIDTVYPMKDAAEAIEKVKNNKVKFRFVLKNDLE